VTEQLVVDANVVAKLYLKDEQYTDRADLLFSRFRQGEIHLAAPRVITYEVPAVIKKGAARAKVNEKTWQAAIQSFELLESKGLLIIDDSKAKYEAIRLAINYRCSYYDALYLLLAEDLGCPFITADDKLVRALHMQAPYLISLASYK
jgi:predicted nucleic acid-binding protein